MGRPSCFQPEFAQQALTLCLLGATDEEMAEFFGVSATTVNNWKQAHPEFLEALKKGKQGADTRVVEALFERATGAEWVEQQAIKLRRVEYDNGKRVLEEERVEVVNVVRRLPSDPTAAIFWLKNRRPQDWRDKREIEVEDKTPRQAETGEAVAQRVVAALPRLIQLFMPEHADKLQVLENVLALETGEIPAATVVKRNGKDANGRNGATRT